MSFFNQKLLFLNHILYSVQGSRCLQPDAINAADDETCNGIGSNTTIRTHDETRTPSPSGSTTRYVLLI